MIGTAGAILLGLIIGYVFYLFAHSALIAHVKGNAVELSESQFPDLHGHFVACCDRLAIQPRPQAFVLNSNGVLNAFATKFLGHQYVVLHSSIVDAMEKSADGIRFYIGHELGHLRRKHIHGLFWRWPVLWLPLVGAAYSRAKESTCDRHGLACSSSPEVAGRSLAALAAGAGRWQSLSVPAYLEQARRPPGFWMSLHELMAAYPWTAKRFARVVDPQTPLPSRNGFAYIFAVFVPFAGRMGAGFGLFVMIYFVGMMAAFAVPAYLNYSSHAKLALVYHQSQAVRDALGRAFESSHHVPQSLSEVNLADKLADGSPLDLNTNNMIVTVTTSMGQMLLVPHLGEDGHVSWSCANGQGMRAAQLPPECAK